MILGTVVGLIYLALCCVGLFGSLLFLYVMIDLLCFVCVGVMVIICLRFSVSCLYLMGC